MALKAQIDADLKAAMLSGDKFLAEVLRGLKAAILNEEVALKKREIGLSDQEIEKVATKEIKKRFESASLYEKNARVELAINEKKEAEILKKYIPEQLSRVEIGKIVAEVIEELDASGSNELGRVIGAVKARVGNSANGGVVAELVKEALNRD